MTTVRKLFGLLSAAERRRLYGLFGAILVMALIEVIGIASIAPFLALVTNPDAIETNPLLSRLFIALKFESQRSFLIFVGMALLAIVTVSNAFAVLVTWALERFSWMRGYSLSRRLIGHYLARPYAFYLNRHTAVLGKNVLTEVREVIKGVLIPSMEVLAKGIVAAAIILLLVVIDPILAIATAGALGSVYGLIFVAVRKKLAYIGRERVHADGQRYQAALEAFAGIKDIKLLGKEREFRRRYSEPALKSANYTATSHVIQKVPHHVVATLMFGGLVFIVIFLLSVRGNIAESIPIIGLYAVASHRLLPALKEIFSGVARMRVSAAALDNICRDLEQDRSATIVNRNGIERVILKERIELDRVSFRYPGAEESVLQEFSLAIGANTSVALVGATGSGKTTTADILLGLLRPDSGRVLIDGVEICPENLPGWQANLGYVPQHIYLTDEKLVRNIAFGVPESEIDMEAVVRAARMANIHDFVVNALPDGYDTVVGERGLRLSGGERQRIGIARALYHDPAVLVLDEATSALDTVTEEGILRALANVRGTKTLLMIAHRLTTIRTCDVVFLLDRGQVVGTGTYDELVRSNTHFRRMAEGKRKGASGEQTRVSGRGGRQTGSDTGGPVSSDEPVHSLAKAGRGVPVRNAHVQDELLTARQGVGEGGARIRVAFLTGRFPAPSETFIVNQIVEAIRGGLDVEVYASRREDLANVADEDVRRLLGERLRDLDVPRAHMLRVIRAMGHVYRKRAWRRPGGLFTALNVVKYGRPALNLRLLYGLLAARDNPAYDIVHCQFGGLGLQVLPLRANGALTGKLVVSFRGADATRGLHQNPNAYRRLFTEADLLLPVSCVFKERLIAYGCDPAKIEVLRSGIPVDRFRFRERRLSPDQPDQEVQVISVGRLTEKKGFRYAVEAVAQVLAHGRRVNYAIVGDGALMADLAGLIERLDLGRHVHLLGWKRPPEVMRLLETAHIMLAPSVTAVDGDQEGIPNALKEAMATGMPVISTRHSGIPELVQDAVSGYLAPERDSDAIATHLTYLIDHPEVWPQMGRAGRERVTSIFDSVALNERLCQLYERLLHSRGPDPGRSRNTPEPVRGA